VDGHLMRDSKLLDWSDELCGMNFIDHEWDVINAMLPNKPRG